MTVKGFVFDLQRFSLHDGPGIRTTVFLKGCPLHCLWCHNPESRHRQPELAYNADRCQHCGECLPVCPVRAHQTRSGQHIFLRENCLQAECPVDFACVTACVYGALDKTGDYRSANEILEIAVKDQQYYRQSGGGLTLSGGEPLSQPDFSYEILAQAKSLDIHTCIETCGQAPRSVFQALMPLVDLWLYDYKVTDLKQHKALTGVSNVTIVENLVFLLENGAHVQLRCPIIPGINDNLEHLQGIARLVQQFPALQGVEILPFHNTAAPKYTRYGLEYPLDGLASMSENQKAQIIEKLRALGCDKALIV